MIPTIPKWYASWCRVKSEESFSCPEGMEEDYWEAHSEDVKKSHESGLLYMWPSISALVDVSTNYDCDIDGHRYDTGCRKCRAIESLKVLGIDINGK